MGRVLVGLLVAVVVVLAAAVGAFASGTSDPAAPAALKVTANIPAFLKKSLREGLVFLSSSRSTCRGIPFKVFMPSPPSSPSVARLRSPSRRV